MSLNLQIHMEPDPELRLKATVVEDGTDRLWEGSVFNDGTTRPPTGDVPEDVQHVFRYVFEEALAGDFDHVLEHALGDRG